MLSGGVPGGCLLCTFQCRGVQIAEGDAQPKLWLQEPEGCGRTIEYIRAMQRNTISYMSIESTAMAVELFEVNKVANHFPFFHPRAKNTHFLSNFPFDSTL